MYKDIPARIGQLIFFISTGVEILPSIEKSKFSRPLQKNRIKKLIYFLFNEGLLKTYRKVQSRKFQSSAEKLQVPIIAWRTLQCRHQSIIGLGLNFIENNSYVFFHQNFVIKVPSSIVQELIEYLKNLFYKDKKFRSCVTKINPFSDLTPSIHIADYIAHRWKIEYPELKHDTPELTIITRQKNAVKFPLYLIGAGDYARTTILPNIKKFHRKCVIDYNINIAQWVAKKYSFDSYGIHCHSCLEEIEKDKNPIIFIAGYHSTHTPIALDILNINPTAKIFIEKPPVTTEDQLKKLLKVYDPLKIFIGYNRRHIPWVQDIKKKLDNRKSPLFINMTIKEITLNPNHWYFWPNQGTRITGNLCHWIDLAVYWVGALPQKLSLIRSPNSDNLVLTILFIDGSLVNLFPTEAGNSLRGVQEKIELRFDETTIFVDDFLKMVLDEGGRRKVRRKILRDKGHDQMYKRFQWAVLNKQSDLYSREDLALSSLIYLKATEMFLKNISFLDFNVRVYKDLIAYE